MSNIENILLYYLYLFIDCFTYSCCKIYLCKLCVPNTKCAFNIVQFHCWLLRNIDIYFMEQWYSEMQIILTFVHFEDIIINQKYFQLKLTSWILFNSCFGLLKHTDKRHYIVCINQCLVYWRTKDIYIEIQNCMY